MLSGLVFVLQRGCESVVSFLRPSSSLQPAGRPRISVHSRYYVCYADLLGGVEPVVDDDSVYERVLLMLAVRNKSRS